MEYKTKSIEMPIAVEVVMVRIATVRDAEQLSVLNDEYMPEITEVYVNPMYRKKGIEWQAGVLNETLTGRRREKNGSGTL